MLGQPEYIKSSFQQITDAGLFVSDHPKDLGEEQSSWIGSGGPWHNGRVCKLFSQNSLFTLLVETVEHLLQNQ